MQRIGPDRGQIHLRRARRLFGRRVSITGRHLAALIRLAGRTQRLEPLARNMKAVKSTPERRLATNIAAPHAGQIIGERYRLEEWLESGAMGSIWRAEQIRLGSAAAVKFLEPSLIEVPEMLERFLQEARSAAAVQSAHVIQVL